MLIEFRHQAERKRLLRSVFGALVVVAASMVLAAQPAAAQWSTVGGDSGNSRYSSLTQIDTQNVMKLGAAWVSEKIGPPPSARAMPLIDDGLMFFTAPPFVTAVNVSTGQIAWQYRLAADNEPGAPVAQRFVPSSGSTAMSTSGTSLPSGNSAPTFSPM